MDIQAALEQIQDRALDESQSLAGTLRLCVSVGGKAGAPELVEWATAELGGYRDGSKVPGYRLVSAPFFMDYINGGNQIRRSHVPNEMLDEELRDELAHVDLRFPVATLEQMASREESTRLSPSGVELLMRLVDDRARKNGNPYFNSTRLYWDLPAVAFGAVVDVIRTRLVELVSRFDTELAKPGIDAAQAAQMDMHIVVESGGTANVTTGSGSIVAGDNATVTTQAAGRNATSNVAPSASKPRFWETSWWTIGRTIGGVATFVVAVAAAYFAYLVIP